MSNKNRGNIRQQDEQHGEVCRLEREAPKLNLSGKLGVAFATEQHVHGGGERTISSILTFMMVYGMMVYSGGGSKGRPVIHLGPVGMSTAIDEYRTLFGIYGQRMADMAVALKNPSPR